MQQGILQSGIRHESRRLERDLFPDLSERERSDLFGTAVQTNYREETCLRTEGDSCSELFFVLSGTLRICKTGTNGKNVTLYRVGRGETCLLSLSSLLQETPFPAYILSEEGTSVLRLPRTTFISWYQHSERWRSFVAKTLARGTMQLVSTLDMVALHHLDAQIVRYLLEESDGSDILRRTHGLIASDLGLSREAVSRSLKKLEREGLLSLTRGEVFLMDRRRLRRVIAQNQ
ncbi:MAG: Crp/Fnr family transcriptional regulator [Candidatus Kapaibacterium sp.]